mgnify:FL=1
MWLVLVPSVTWDLLAISNVNLNYRALHRMCNYMLIDCSFQRNTSVLLLVQYTMFNKFNFHVDPARCNALAVVNMKPTLFLIVIISLSYTACIVCFSEIYLPRERKRGGKEMQWALFYVNYHSTCKARVLRYAFLVFAYGICIVGLALFTFSRHEDREKIFFF